MFRKTCLLWKNSKCYIFRVSIALAIQQAKGMRRCHLSPVWLYHIFPHYLINYTTIRETLLSTEYVFWFSVQLLSETFDIISRNERDIFIIVCRLSCEVTNVLENWIFSMGITKIRSCTEFMKIRLVEVEVFHVDGRTDRQTWRSQ